MSNKKGISPVISWVLILGFSMTLAVVVTSWYLQQSEQMTESSLTTLEGGMECNEVSINVAYTYDGVNCWLKVSNTGKYKIDSVKINTVTKPYDKNPKEYWNFTNNDPDPLDILCEETKITVNPILKRGDNLISCPNDRIYEQKTIP
ncbi:MAG: hypothetical protein V1914_03825 [archaeon]